ncbi:MAG: MBL fold metallo-hydrolase [Thermoplasmata archaeon]
MVSITIYGGADEIGGNKILVESQGTRVMLDFGTRMGFESKFFSEFVKARSNTGLRDRLILGSLPLIPGIYRANMIRPSGLDEVESEGRVLTEDSKLLDFKGLVTYEDYVDKCGRGYLDAMFLSHAHFDHVGDMNCVHPDIPLYCSSTTKLMVEAVDELTNFKSQAISMKRPEIAFGKSGSFADKPKLNKKNKSERDCFTLEEGRIISIGSMKIRAIKIDHSVPGANSFVLDADGKRILYTGDIRFHGTFPLSIDDYVELVGKDINVMICEGTRIDSDSLITEEMVRERMVEEMKEVEGLVFVDFSWKDTTRYETIRRACEECDRVFVINARLAFLLNLLNEKPDMEKVKVFLKRKGSALYSPADYSRSKYEYGYSVDKEDLDSSHYENGLTALDIIKEPGKYVLMFSYYDLNQLFDFADSDGVIPGSRFIKAQCEPFSDDMALDEERLINWLEMLDIDFKEGEPEVPEDCKNPGCEKIKRVIDRSHVSGHASRPELKEMIAKLKPDVLMPVHTLDPGEFKRIAEELEKEHRIKVIPPKRGKTYEL